MSSLCNHSLELTGPLGDPAGPVRGLDPRAKIVALVGITLVAVSAPLALWPVFAACLALLAAIALVARVPAAGLWRRARVAVPLLALVAISVPFVRTGGESWALGPLTVHEAGLETFATVALKTTVGMLSAALLTATTPFPDLLRGLEALRVPRLLVLIAAFMYRYLFVIVDEVGRMRSALVARAYRPRQALGAAALGRVAAALFLRAHARGERVHSAMLARGFSGRMPQAAPLVLRRADLAFVALALGLLVSLRLAAELTA